MSEKQLAYMLEQTAVAVRMMAEDGHAYHRFNYGPDKRTGEMHVVIIAVVPESTAAEVFEEFNERRSAEGG